MSDYSVNWYLNNTLLPLISEDTTDFLVESNKCSIKELPHTFTTQKGPEPGKLVVVLPYGELGVFLPNITSGPTYVGNNTLKIVWKDLKSKPPLINLPNETIEIKNLYVTNISETITHVNNIDSNDLVIVTLHDVRYFLNKDSPFNKTKFSSDIMSSSDTVAERIWEEYFKDMYKSKSLVSTNKFHPEVAAGVDTNYVQFSVDNFQSDWKTFNEACNRTENVFFIDYNGDPVIQANSFSLTNVLSTTPSYPPKQFLDDSVYSHTLDNEARNNLFNDWETTVGNFWSSQSKSSFHEVENNPTGFPSISKSNINLFPLSIHRYSGSLENNKTDYLSIIEAYESEINDTFDIEVVRVCHNGIVYVELNSQVTQVTYTNNSVGVFTYFDCEFRHAIPFYEFDDKFNDEFIPTLHAKADGTVFPRNESYVRNVKGFNMPLTSWYQEFETLLNPAGGYEPQGHISGSDNYMFRGFWNDTDFYGGPKVSVIDISDRKTNAPNFYSYTDGALKVERTGYYRIKYSGKAKLPLVGTIPYAPQQEMRYLHKYTPTIPQGPVDQEIDQGGQGMKVEMGKTATYTFPIYDTWPTNIQFIPLLLSSYSDNQGENGSQARAEASALSVHFVRFTQPDDRQGFDVHVTFKYDRTVYCEDDNNPGFNLFGGTDIQSQYASFYVESIYTPSVPLYVDKCNFLAAREEFKVLLTTGGVSKELGEIKFPDTTATDLFKRDTSSLLYDHYGMGPTGSLQEYSALTWKDRHSSRTGDYFSSFVISRTFTNGFIYDLSATNNYGSYNTIFNAQYTFTDRPVEPTTTEYRIFFTPFNVEDIVKLNKDDPVSLYLQAESQQYSIQNGNTDTNKPGTYGYAARRVKLSSVVGPIETTGTVSLEFISETNPVNQSYDI